MIVISDTSAITNLAAIDQLKLLPLLYGQVIIPEAVYRELVDIDPRGCETSDGFFDCYLRVSSIFSSIQSNFEYSQRKLVEDESDQFWHSTTTPMHPSAKRLSVRGKGYLRRVWTLLNPQSDRPLPFPSPKAQAIEFCG